MARRQYLVAYDISDDKRRTKVFETLTGQGDHVQFSVFLCALNPQELATLRGALQSLIDARQDQIILVELGVSHSRANLPLECLGKPYNPATRVQVF